MQVAQILKGKASGVVTIRPEATIAEAVQTLMQKRIGAVVVTNQEGHLAGILSERDIVRGLAEKGTALLNTPVAGLMTRTLVTCSPTDTLEDIMREMTSRRFRHLPVLKDGELLGIVSIGDVVKNRLDELESESTMLRQYIVGS